MDTYSPVKMIPSASAQLASRLPCQRCVRRLACEEELDSDIRHECIIKTRRIRCDYCYEDNRKCYTVPYPLAQKVSRLWEIYNSWCDDPNDDIARSTILEMAKDLDREMKNADNESIKTMPDFTAAERTRVPSGAVGRAHPDDVNNNLRLLVDAVRRLTEVIASHTDIQIGHWPE